MPLRTAVRELIVVQENVVEYVCNACGKSRIIAEGSFSDAFDYHIIRLSGGWGNQFPGDMQTMTIAVCEDCLRNWVSTFKYPNVLEPPVIQALHAETGETLSLTECLAHPADMPEDEVQRLLKECYAIYDDEANEVWANVPDVRGGIWEHFKGRRYLVKASYIHFTPDLVPCVLYRELYGESNYWLRPLSMWVDHVKREGYVGPRFKRVGDLPRRL